jgi:hypothetical protein
MRCVDLFCRADLEGKVLQIAVDEAFPDFACETESCSPHSPGPVLDDEIVAFLLVNPLHYDKERDVIVPDAFQELTNRDLSVLRAAHSTREEACETRDALVARGGARLASRAVDEVCIAETAKLRGTLGGRGRVLGVFDTGLENKPSHASIFTTKEVLSDKRMRKELREHVHRIMTRRRSSFEDFIKILN